MSKMPAKKKSCFQITSVTQAQVAASNATDDTESLDDPDDSRAEDVSSEIFDVTRADYEPAACDRSSSEEALTFNNVGEPPEHQQTHIPQQVGQLSASQLSGNPNGTFRIVAVSGPQQAPGAYSTQPGAIQVQPQPALTAGGGGGGPAGVSASTSQPAPAASSSTPSSTTTSTTVSCSSRFRVIKLDHGTGEPFRRGRWTCTEFYEKDSDGSIVSRTVDSIRHASATTVDPGIDRDSGLGQTGGSVVTPVATHSGQGLGSIVDSSLSASRMPSVDTLQQQLHHPTYSVVKQGGSGTATAQQQQPAAVGLQPSNAQTLLPIGHNGLPQGGVHLQKSPGMPPAGQPVSYPPQQQQQQMLQQVPTTTHHLTGQSAGLLMNQTEYYQQQPQPAAQTHPATSLSAGAQLGGQGPSPVMTPAASMQSQVAEMAGASGGTVPPGQTASGLLQQHLGGGMLGVGRPTLQPMSVGQYVVPGQPHGLHPAPSSGVQNVPVVAASPGVPTTVPAAVPSASSAVMPNLTSSPLSAGQQSLMPQSNMVAPGGMVGQGLPMAGFVPGEAGSGRRIDGLATSPQPPITYGKDLMKPLIPESLQLATPTVNSLFGISIPVDGDEDRNPSKAFYRAFSQPGSSRLRDSKVHSDSASGTSVVAIDNKIEQAMDLVKSHLMYAVREEVEVLKEQIKELFERNSMLERENAVLKSLANSEQLSQLPTQQQQQSTITTTTTAGAPLTLAVTPPQQGLSLQAPQTTTQSTPPQVQLQPHHQPHNSDPSNGQQQLPQQQPSVTSA